MEEAYKSYGEAKKNFQGTSMNLREWMLNSAKFIDLLPKAEISAGNICDQILENRPFYHI